MVDVIRDLDAARVRANLDRVRREIDAAATRAGRDPATVELLAAVKYVPAQELPVLAEAGIDLVGENRAQELAAKHAWHGERFTWDFIGHLQSRKVQAILPLVRYVHSVASDSALAQLERHAGGSARVMVEVNVAEEEGKSGIVPGRLRDFLGRCPVEVVGLMTMPPSTNDPETSRPWFAALAGLGREHGLRELSMGTSQDFAVAVEEGATIVRLGGVLYAEPLSPAPGPGHNRATAGNLRPPANHGA